MIDDVRAAQRGDTSAFDRLVARYRATAVSYARSWLGEAEAEDAAQDAFIDVHRSLSQLREPGAFPGWLRRVVRKHCDRRTRRQRPDFVTGWTDAALGADLDLDARADAQRHARGLRAGLSRLPEPERIALALHYLAEMPVADIAAFLELGSDAVKKRLQRGRARLADVVLPGPLQIDATKFGRAVGLYLAISAGDRNAVRDLLDAEPELVNRPEAWSDAEALAGRFPLAHARTPLILAAGRGDRALVRLLLDRGAEVDARCGCAQGESALFTAALHGWADVAADLVAAGADVDAVNAAGLSARDVAALRGHDAVIDVLPPRSTGSSADAGPSDARPGVLRASADDPVVVPTGIKAVDLFAPLGPTALVRVAGAAETGLMVLLAELARSWGEAGGHAVWTTGDETPAMWGDLAAFARETGIERHVTVCGPDALAVAEQKNAAGRAALFVLVPEDRQADADVALPRLRTAAARVFVVEPWTAQTRGDIDPPDRLAAPWDAQIVTSLDRAARGLFPALDFDRTTSRTPVTDEHARLRAWARANPASVEAALAQPFTVWTHQTGVPGASFDLATTLALVRSAE
jgi:RNA polymerase sigma factor (sigma-70 family)